MSIMGRAVLDFGSTPTDIATVAITGQGGILGTSFVEAWIDPTTSATPDHSNDEHTMADFSVRCRDIIPGVGFTIQGDARSGLEMGKWNISWVWT
jgi:hypothetical protein